jgi:hypothetical protein
MSLTIDQFYQEIGQQARAAADGLAGRLLVYAEVEDAVISADLFYATEAGVVRHRFTPKKVQNLIYAFLEQWKTQPGRCEWWTLCYVVDDGKFSIDLAYPDQSE